MGQGQSTPLKLSDDARFKDLWLSDRSQEQMAGQLGVTIKTLVDATKRFGYPSFGWRRGADLEAREKCLAAMGGNDAGKDHSAQMLDKVSQKRLAHIRKMRGKCADHPFWDEAKDFALVQTDGGYAKMKVLSERWGQTMRVLQARWHLMRLN